MKIKEYFFLKLFYIIINLIIYFLFLVFMSIVGMFFIILLSIFIIWFFFLIIYIIIDFIKKKRFYDDICGIINELDKKYLLFEVIKLFNYYEGKVIYEVLCECNRDMYEYVNFYKNF